MARTRSNRRPFSFRSQFPRYLASAASVVGDVPFRKPHGITSPKVTAPLEIILVDVEVVGVGEAAQQGRRQRSEIGSALGRPLTVN